MKMPLPVNYLLVIDPCLEAQARIAHYVQGRGVLILNARTL
jgi:hypothetical protein